MEEKSPKNIILVVALALGFLLIIYLFFTQERSADKDISMNGFEIESTNEESDIEESTLVIDISGAVVSKGVYSLSEGSLVLDAINIAGGLSPEADTLYVDQNMNMAALLVTNQKIYIPYLTDDYSNEGMNDVEPGKVSINGATQDQLEALPGVGPATAQKIIGNRPYLTLEELKEVKGIGDSTYEELVEYITL